MSKLPDPAAIHERASDTDPESPFEILVAPTLDTELTDPDARRVDGAYKGPDAAAVGLLAAACEANVGDIRYPNPTLTGEGPWIVLDSSGGLIRTVECGEATVEIGFGPLPNDSTPLQTQRKRIDSVFSAAQPRHPTYPVDADEQGVFTTGMTTFEPVSVTSDTVTLRTSTTPVTTGAAIRERFVDCPGVESVSVKRVAGVERADPEPAFREAVQDAHVSVFGDCEYAWAPETTALSAIPSANKVAIGTGQPQRFDTGDLADAAALLTRTANAYGGES